MDSEALGRYCPSVPPPAALLDSRRRRLFREDALTNKYLLKLYVAGSTPRATLAIENLKRLCESDLSGRYDLEIIDVLEHPELAEQDKILATPTLIKQLPPPLRRVIGDLSDSEKVLLGLELRQLPPAPPQSSDRKKPG
jgi:circadian clock protein KaiB